MNAPQPSLQLDAALQARDRGWRPFPLDHPELPECAGPTGHPCQPKDRGKHPAVSWATATASEPPDKLLRHWWSGGPRNVGIACGPSGLLVVDEDEHDALQRFADERREKLPKTYRVQTARGWHWYWDVTDLDVVIGNSPGLLGPHGMDVRGGKGGGGYVVGAGSIHVTGCVYIPEDPYLRPARPADWMVSAILTKPPAGPAVPQTLPQRGSGGSPLGDGFALTSFTSDGWTDLPRYGTTDALLAQYYRHLAAVQGRGDEFRHSLYLAALDGWRLVDIGLYTEAGLYADLRGRIRTVWGAPPDERDRQIVSVEARTKATESPWVVIDAAPVSVESANGSPMPVTHSDEPGDAPETSRPPTAEQVHELQVQAEVNRLALVAEARRRLALRDRPTLQVMEWDDYLDAPTVDYLVDGMLWRTGTTRVFGPPGETKSFLVLDIALALASATPWVIGGGEALSEPAVVHYVMAEGQAVNTARTRAWLQHHRVDRDAPRGWFKAIPQGVLLTPEGIEQYLELVDQDRPAWIILDTKHRMMAGDENSAADAAVLVRALDALRDASSGNVTVVDHTGLSDRDRARGSSSVLGAMDTEVKVTLDRETAIACAEVTRDKAATSGRKWSYRLKPVTVGLRHEAVVAPASESAGSPFLDRAGRWWDMDQPPVPEVVARLSGRGADAAKDIYRVLRFVGDPDGLTSAQIRSMVDEGPRTHARSAFFTGLQVLKAHRMVGPGATESRLRLISDAG